MSGCGKIKTEPWFEIEFSSGMRNVDDTTKKEQDETEREREKTWPFFKIHFDTCIDLEVKPIQINAV